MILPKVSSTSKNSMSLKNVSNPEISKRCLNNSKGKVILRIADPGLSNSTKKSLPTKPKNYLSQVQDYPEADCYSRCEHYQPIPVCRRGIERFDSCAQPSGL